MTNKEAAQILEKQKREFLDEWVDFGGITEAYNKAIELLNKQLFCQEAQLVLNIGEQISCKTGSCPKCGKMLNTTCNKRYCGDCGHAVKWE